MRFLQMGVPPWKTPTCQVWWPQTLWKWRYKYSCKYGYFTAKVTATILKKRLWHRCFPVNFTKFLRTPFLTEHLGWLLLEIGGLIFGIYVMLLFAPLYYKQVFNWYRVYQKCFQAFLIFSLIKINAVDIICCLSNKNFLICLNRKNINVIRSSLCYFNNYVFESKAKTSELLLCPIFAAIDIVP